MTLPTATVRIPRPAPSWADALGALGPLIWARLSGSSLTDSGSDPDANLTALGGVLLDQPGLIAGDPDTAVALDGIDDRVEVRLVDAVGGAGGITLGAWGAATVDKDGYFLIRSGTGYLRRIASSDSLAMSWYDGSAVQRTLTAVGAWPADGVARFAVGTIDPAGVARLYVDGAQVATTAAYAGHSAVPAGTWNIGAASGGASNQWAGRLDEVFIVGRPLTAAEVADLYAIGAGLVGGVPLECQILRGVIRHGRDDPNAQPEADAATLELVGVLPPEVEIGAPVEVVAHFAGVDYPRFAGRISDVAIGWDSIDVPISTVIATGELADMGRRIIGDAPYPAERDGDRANRAIAAAGVRTDALRSDPGVLNVLPRDVDAQPALAVASDAGLDGNGFVWQACDGAVLYADAQHRRAAGVAWEVDACDLPASLVWAKGLVGLANDARVRWGSPEAEVREINAASVADLGTFGASLTTRLASQADAEARANFIIARQAYPAWTLAGLAFLLEAPNIGPADTTALLALEVHDLLSVTGMPAGAPMTSALTFVEGWTETIAADAWALELAVSDYCRTAPAPTWDQTSPEWVWDTLDPGLTWDGTTCLPPYVGRGRWVDVPASQRWDQTPPATTWDTWQA
jgi:hypothetical protein